MRTVVNALADGSVVRAGDSGARRMRWELRYSGLTVAEWQAIEQLFVATQGQVGSFTFLDPVENLLAWSEDFSKGVWRVDPLLQEEGGGCESRGGAWASAPRQHTQATAQGGPRGAGAERGACLFSL